MRILVLLALVLSSPLTSSCAREPEATASTSESEETSPVRYGTRGRIEALTPMRADIAHEDVPGYMPAMTMPFFAKEEGQLAPFSVGDSVEFTFEVQEAGRHEIVEIRKR
jgi:protein SCO1/2